MSARPSRKRNEVTLKELYKRLKDIDLAIRSLEEIERTRANSPLAVVEQILSREGSSKFSIKPVIP